TAGAGLCFPAPPPPPAPNPPPPAPPRASSRREGSGGGGRRSWAPWRRSAPRGGGAGAGEGAPPTGTATSPRRGGGEWRASGGTADALTEGRKAEPRDLGPLTRRDFVRYQGASGDFNPIHHDEEYAKGAGFPTVFSVGMLQAGILATYATDWLGAADVRRFGVQFREQGWPGDTLTCTGEGPKRYHQPAAR